jgi:hypothetical protein
VSQPAPQPEAQIDWLSTFNQEAESKPYVPAESTDKSIYTVMDTKDTGSDSTVYAAPQIIESTTKRRFTATPTPSPTRTSSGGNSSGNSFGPSGDISSILNTIVGTVGSIFAIKAQSKAVQAQRGYGGGRTLRTPQRNPRSAFPVSTLAMVGIGVVAVGAVVFIASRD